MNNLHISVLENVFEDEKVPMSHISILGKAGSGKTELLKQIVGSFLQSGKKVIWFNPMKETSAMIQKWGGYKFTSLHEVNKEILTTHQLFSFQLTSFNFEILKTLLTEDSSEWILVHDAIDELSWNYEQNDFVTQKLDFLYFVSEFGRVFNLYTLVTGQDIETIDNVLPTRKIIENTKNLLLLNQTKSSLDYLSRQKVIDKKQVEKLDELRPYEAVFLRK